MITNDIMDETYRIQKQLAKASKNVHDYFVKTHKSAQKIMDDIGIRQKHVSTDWASQGFSKEE